MADNFWIRWEKDHLLELRSFDEISQPKGGGQGGLGLETSSSSRRIAAPDTWKERSGGGAEGGEREGQKNGCTPWGKRNHFSLPCSAGHPPGG